LAIGNHTLPTEIFKTCTDGMMVCFAEWAFEISQGTFWVFALAAFCIILMLSLNTLGTNKSFGYASFVGMMGAVWLSIMGLMIWWIASIFLILGFIGIAMLILSER